MCIRLHLGQFNLETPTFIFSSTPLIPWHTQLMYGVGRKKLPLTRCSLLTLDGSDDGEAGLFGKKKFRKEFFLPNKKNPTKIWQAMSSQSWKSFFWKEVIWPRSNKSDDSHQMLKLMTQGRLAGSRARRLMPALLNVFPCWWSLSFLT